MAIAAREEVRWWKVFSLCPKKLFPFVIMSQQQLQYTIQEILANLKGLSSLKELFAELNYDRANVPLSQRNWSETTASLLAADPLLLATAGEDFHIIYCRLNSDQLWQTADRTSLRPVYLLWQPTERLAFR